MCLSLTNAFRPNVRPRQPNLRHASYTPLPGKLHDHIDAGGAVSFHLFEAHAVVEMARHLVVGVDLQHDPAPAATARMFDGGVHEPARDAAPTVVGRDSHVGDLPALADLVAALHGDIADDLAALQAELTGDGFDYAFEAIGVPAVMRQAYDATRRGGTCCVVGVGAMDQEVAFNGFEIFFNEKNFTGSYYGSVDVRKDFARFLQLWKDGELDLDGMISKRMKIDDINDAFDAMRKGEVIRTVVTF